MSDDVLEGVDGWLFLKGGSNNPFDYYFNKQEYRQDLVDGWGSLLVSRSQKLEGRRYIHLFVPNKETIYADKTGLPFPDSPGNPLSVLFRKMAGEQRGTMSKVAIDPTNYFKKIKANIQLYWKTDSHWNYSGCYAAYQLLCSKLGVLPIKDLLSRPFSSGLIALDLGGKLVPVIKEQVRFYNFCQHSVCSRKNDLLRFKEDFGLDNVAGLHVGSSVVYVNPEAPQKFKVVIFGDSFSECRPSLLTGMLAETFSEVHFIWSASIDFDYIEEANPDVVITEIAERFMVKVPNDLFNLKTFSSRQISEYALAHMSVDEKSLHYAL